MNRAKGIPPIYTKNAVVDTITTALNALLMNTELLRLSLGKS
jgi:hypothetical protein